MPATKDSSYRLPYPFTSVQHRGWMLMLITRVTFGKIERVMMKVESL